MLLNENVIVVPDKDSGALSVAGPVSDVNRLEKSLSEIINKIAKTIHREKSSKTEEIKVSPSVFHLLCQDGLMDKLLLVYPELKLAPESPNLKITAYFSTIKTKTGCLVQLVDKPGGGQDNVKQVPTPLYQLKMPGGVEIAVYKADMCSYPMQAVVSPFNQDLKHSTGLAAALLKAAGPQLQDEFYKMKKTKGQLKPGDCVITDAGGTLCCQKVIHAVAPKYEKPQQASAQLNKVVKGSLEAAENHGCISVALPSIGRGMRCFPLKQCELTIVKAVKEYCYENYDDIILQKIHFVNNDDIAVQDMVAAL
uniref:Macro domain-containing protein n=1 Tax=Pundamilia nyererei TaxID=303518 RepID=A0A3B4G6N9_9CICH